MAETSANFGIEVGEKSVSGFVAYIAQFDAQFPKRIQGATEEEIDQLEETVRRPLPAEYRDFLRYLGNGYDRLIFAGECNAKISSVSKYYEIENKYRNSGDSEEVSDEDTYDPPEGCLVIGAFCLSSDDMCLDLRKEGTAPVIIMSNGETVFYSDSLLQLLYCRGYTAYRLRVLPQFRFFVTDAGLPVPKRESFERAVAWASAAPWSRQWFSDKTSLCVEGKGTAFCLSFFDQTGYTLHIGGESGSNLNATVQAISQIIGVPLTESSVDDD
jgi:hypothetical protein